MPRRNCEDPHSRNSRFLHCASPAIDWLVAVVLAVLVVVTRLPFRTSMLYNWDSANFALGIRHFDVTVHAPHPPGYFFYVAVANLIDAAIGDANASLVALSLAFSVGAVVSTYFLGKAMSNRPAGLIAALLLAFSVTFWTYGELALAYVTLAFFSSLVALFAWRIVGSGSKCQRRRVPAKASDPGDEDAGEPQDRRLQPLPPANCAEGSAACGKSSGTGLALLLSAVYVLGSGFRPDLLLFLAPLWLWSLWRQGWKTRFLCLATALAGFLLWYVPTALLSGGFAQYHAVLAAYTAVDVAERYSSTNKGLAGLTVNVRDTASYAFYALYAAALPLAAAGLWFLTQRRLWLSRKTVFFIVWITPMIIFYTVIHIGDPGYVFTFLPAIMVLLGAFVCFVYEGEAFSDRSRGSTYDPEGNAPPLRPWRRIAVVVVVVAVLATNTGIFLLHPRPMTAQGIRQNDLDYREKMEFIRSRVDPHSTILLSYDSYKHLMYYLTEYRQSIWVDVFAAAEEQVRIPPGVKSVLLVDTRLNAINRSPQATSEIGLPSGGKMYALTVVEDQVLTVGGKAIEVQ